MSAPTLITPYGYSSSSCGYCSPSGERSSALSCKKFGVESSQMSVQFYQNMIDRGWRRSGTYLYHPDMARTCCPQYTIRLDVEAFKPTKKHRQVINRFNRFLSTGERPGESSGGDRERISIGHGDEPWYKKSEGTGNGNRTATGNRPVRGKGNVEEKKGKGKSNGKDQFSFIHELRSYQVGYGEEGKHRFETMLVPAKPTAETFALYTKYQVSVHKDAESKVSFRGFDRFLCSSPLLHRPVKYRADAETSKLPKEYGSYHLLYKVDKQLIGISVLDILPTCVSSVYFIWDPDWAWASLGKLSALMEIALGLEMKSAGAKDMGWLYMGYWIADCIKMRYKSEYSPSFLLDPGTNTFHPLTSRLDKFLQSHPRGYNPFLTIESLPEETIDQLILKTQQNIDDISMTKTKSENSDEEVDQLDEWPDPPPPGFGNLEEVNSDEVLVFAVLRKKPQLISFRVYQTMLLPEGRKRVLQTIAAIGEDLMAKTECEPEMLMDLGMLYFDF